MWRYSLFIIGAVLMAGCGGGDGFDCPNAGLASTSLTTAMEEEGGADNTTADADTTSTNNFPSTPIPQSGGSLCPVDLSGGHWKWCCTKLCF